MKDIAILDFNNVCKMSSHLCSIYHTNTWEGEVYHLQVLKHQLKVPELNEELCMWVQADRLLLRQ